MAVTYSLDNRTDKNGDAPIRMSITIEGARYLTSSGYKIAPDKWNKEKQRVKNGASNGAGIRYNTINAALADIEKHFADYADLCKKNGIKPDRAALMQEFANAFGRKKVKEDTSTKVITFWDYFDTFVKEMGAQNSWTKATYQKFAALKSHLNGFNDGLSFADLNEPGLNAFVAYLRAEKDMKNTTIGKQLGFLKWFLKWAFNKGYNTNNAYLSFAPKLKTTGHKVIYLEWTELMTVLNYVIPANGTDVTLCDADGNQYTKTVHDAAALEKTRDVFCFCAFTSLRYSDAINLKRADIIGDEMTITTVKTADTVSIELNKYAHIILDKYKDRTDLGGYVFPRITNQRMNMYLKDLCELCGINTPITQTYYKGSDRFDEVSPKYALIGTHCGRRTFVCNALMLGIPAEVIMEFTGHSDYKSMKPYIAIANSAKKKAMEKFNNL